VRAGSTPASGTVTLVARTAGALDKESAYLAGVFAVHAAIALAASEAVQQLAAAISTREVIEQARAS